MNQIVVRLLLISSVFLLAASAASAMIYRLADDVALADQADVVVQGRVVHRVAVDRDGQILTLYLVAPNDVFKGTVGGSTIGVEVLGGEMPDGRILRMIGSPSFDLDQEVLLFLRARSNGRFRIMHVFQGAFHPVATAAGRAWFRPIDETEHQAKAKRDGGYAQADQVRDGRLFAAWLRDQSVGTTRSPDYFVAAGTASDAIQKFTLLDETDDVFERWFLFDRGERMIWFRDETGQSGSPDGGASAFAAARQAWNSEPNTPIRLRDGGTTSSRTGFGPLDGRNTILYDDYNGDFDSDYSCQTGGTLARGGYRTLNSAPTMQWKGRSFREPLEAEIIVNTGFACEAGNNAYVAELFTHELGHTLGLGHSCGGDQSPACSTSAILDNAVMRAGLKEPAQGAVLRADDMAGIRFLYEPETAGCSEILGNGRYCSDPTCGPCTEGQGDCDNDAECAGGLTCGTNNGAMFGFAPGIDVCVATGPVQCTEPMGSGRYCSDPNCGPCGEGQGDCDSNAECLPGLTCVDNNGALFGFAPGIDVCVSTDVPPTDCPLPNGNGRYCSDPRCGPCFAGEGDCDSDAECAGEATCGTNNGALFGFAPGIDVCIGGSTCTETLGTGRYCSTVGCGPCGEGQGDCDTDAECASGLACVQNIGALFGFAPGVDVCTVPSAP